MALRSEKVHLVRAALLFTVLGIGSCLAAETPEYCYQFTWVGPRYDKDDYEDFGDMSCKAGKYAPPCYSPLVITEDGTPPDTTHMWETMDRERFTCKLTKNTVCIKWLFKYNGIIENITYFCGKMTLDNKPLTNSCQQESSKGYTTIACACTDSNRMPCNGAFAALPSSLISLLVMASTLGALRAALSRSCFL